MKLHLDNKNWEYIIVTIVGFAYFLIAAWPSLQSDWMNCEDAAQHLIWLHDVNWPETIYTEVAKAIQPWGVQVLHGGLSYLFSPYLITIWLPLPLTLITIGFTFAAARKYSNFILAMTFALLVTHYAYPELAGGFARSFCMPLLVAFWYTASQAKWSSTALVILLSGLFYPTAALISMGCLVLLFVWSLFNRSGLTFPRFWSRDFKLLLGAGLLALGLMVAKSYSLQQHPYVGPFHDVAYIKTAPEFGAKGRVRFAHELKTTTPNMLRFTVGRRLKLPKERYSLYTIGILNFLLGLLLIRRPIFRAFRVGVLLLASAMLGHFFAQVLAPQLFIPDRFLSYPGAFFTAFILWYPLAALFSLIEAKEENNYEKTYDFSWRQAPGLLLSILALVFLFTWMPKNPKVMGRSVDNYRNLAPLFTAIRALPEQALILGPPKLSDQITFQGQRAVFVSDELAHALYFKNYHKITDDRWRSYVSAYLSHPDEADQLISFLQNNNITHLLIDTKQLSKGQFKAFFEPYRTMAKELLNDRDPTTILLNQIPTELGDLIQDRFRLIETRLVMTYLEGRLKSEVSLTEENEAKMID